MDFPGSEVPFSQIMCSNAQYVGHDTLAIEKHAADDRLSMRTVAEYRQLNEMDANGYVILRQPPKENSVKGIIEFLLEGVSSGKIALVVVGVSAIVIFHFNKLVEFYEERKNRKSPNLQKP